MIALRLILFLVILTSAGVIAIAELQLKPKLVTMADDKKKVDDDLTKEKSERTKQETRAKGAEQERDALKNDLDTSKKAEADAMKAAADERVKAAAAAQETAKAKQETDLVKVRSAEYFDLEKLGLTPPVIKRINNDLPKATNELNTLKREQQLVNIQLVKTSGELNAILNPKGAVALPRELTGKVSAVDPKWDFVILDIGASHGLLRNGELTVEREGKLIARVKVGRVETDYAIANIMPGLKKADIREGDVVRTPSPTVLPLQR